MNHHQLLDGHLRAAQALLQVYENDLFCNGDIRPGSKPIILLHSAGTEVHGTVLIFHGFTSHAAASEKQARYFFDRQFNVIALNLAGHHLSPSLWPHTTFRDANGMKAAREALLSDAVLGPLIRDLNSSNVFDGTPALYAVGALMQRVTTVLKAALAAEQFESMQRAFIVLEPGREIDDSELERLLDSTHNEYEREAQRSLDLIAPLPGPVYVVGFSLGTVAALGACATGKVNSAALLGTFSGVASKPSNVADVMHFLSCVAALALFDTLVPQSDGSQVLVPGPVYAAALISGSCVRRGELTSTVRSSSRCWGIIAEDDTIIDAQGAVQFCTQKLGGSAYMYPRKYGIGHELSPEVGNKFGDPLLIEIARFFLEGTVHEHNLTIDDNVPHEECKIHSN